MQIEICNYNTEYKYLKFTYFASEDKKLLEELSQKATDLAKKVNIHSPGGYKRNFTNRYWANLGGVIAENSTKQYLEKLIKENKVDASIVSSEYYIAKDHVDLAILVNDSPKRIEVRSSFGYKTSFNRYFEGAFSTIGWYISGHKAQEDKKDYYFFGFHHYAPQEITAKLKDKLVFYLIGAASKETLEKIGQDDNLKQYNAKFRIIKPIIRAPTDPISVFEECLNIKSTTKIGKQQTLNGF